MLRHIVGGIVVGLAAAWVGSLPAARPYMEGGQLRLVGLLDRASLAFEGQTWYRRLLGARIEPVADFPDGTVLRQIGQSVGMLWIDVTDGKGKSHALQCTATLIAPALLITNHHCLEADKPGERRTLELWIDYRGGTPVRHKVDPTPVEIDAKLDFALMRLMPPATGREPQSLAHLRFRTALPGERLFLLHHAASKPLQVTRARCRAEASNAAGDHVLRHTCATSPGSSGALVFAAHDHAIVGLHRARRKRDDQAPGVATPAAALLAKSAALRRLAPAGLVQAAIR